jgi:hypothetical protein
VHWGCHYATALDIEVDILIIILNAAVILTDDNLILFVERQMAKP